VSPSGFPAPTRKEHQKFCVTEGWAQVRNARSKTGDHWIYELVLPDGRTLRTRVSHPVNRDGYGVSMWSHILRDQLDVTEAEFWDCVQHGVKPSRGVPPPPQNAIPAPIIGGLLASGIPDDEVRAMTKAQAIQRMTEIWSQQR